MTFQTSTKRTMLSTKALWKAYCQPRVLDDLGAEDQARRRPYGERPADYSLRAGYLLPREGVGDDRKSKGHDGEAHTLDGAREEQEVYRGREARYPHAEGVECQGDQDHPLLAVVVPEPPEEGRDRAPHDQER